VKLVDTSVWIELFRARTPLELERVVSFDEIVTCLPVIQEVLQGFRDEGAYRRAQVAMFALPLVESPLEATLFQEAVDLYRAARRAGITVRSSVDCLIAACAIRHDLELVHADRDYGALSRVSKLRACPIRGRAKHVK
jgi:predicted nucleic acid-binding protein